MSDDPLTQALGDLEYWQGAYDHMVDDYMRLEKKYDELWDTYQRLKEFCNEEQLANFTLQYRV